MKRNKNIDIKNIDNCEKLKKTNIPVLILHGEKDEITPVQMAYNLYSVLPEKSKEIKIFNNAGHLQSLEQDKYLYKSAIKNFLIKYVD